MLVAIHQPNFLPWLGYFDKLARADVFVLLDNVPLQKTGGSYTNRVEIAARGRRQLLTVPIVRSAETRQSIDAARIVDAGPWRRKLRATIEQAYARAPAFAKIMPIVARILDAPGDRLAGFNIEAIRLLASLIGLDVAKMRRASDLEAAGTGTDRLIAIVRSVGGSAYLCGGGAGGYQEDDKFAAAGLQLRYQDFKHPSYPQTGTANFIAGLSIIDALMNCGVDGTAGLLSVRQPVGEATR
jgi:hypothetical protein